MKENDKEEISVEVQNAINFFKQNYENKMEMMKELISSNKPMPVLNIKDIRLGSLASK